MEYLFVSLRRGTFVHLSPAFQVPFPSPHPPTMVTRKRKQAVKIPLTNFVGVSAAICAIPYPKGLAHDGKV
jgi:hypothetical protein